MECKAELKNNPGWKCSNKAKKDGFCLIHHPDCKHMREKGKKPTVVVVLKPDEYKEIVAAILDAKKIIDTMLELSVVLEQRLLSPNDKEVKQINEVYEWMLQN